MTQLFHLVIYSLNKWLNQRHTCPTCREITSKAVVLFFDGADLNSTQTEDDVDSLKVKKVKFFQASFIDFQASYVKRSHLFHSHVPLLILILKVKKAEKSQITLRSRNEKNHRTHFECQTGNTSFLLQDHNFQSHCKLLFAYLPMAIINPLTSNSFS